MKKQTKSDKCKDLYDAFQCIRDDRPVKRVGAKDGSIPTKSVVPVPDLPERGDGGVQDVCRKWLDAHRIFHSPHDCGAGDFGYGYATYGIKSAGDDIGFLPDGRYFELEYKKGKGGKLSKGQQKRMRKIKKANGFYFVIHGVPELIYYFEGLI